MKIVGTIVNKDMTLQGLLLKGRPSEFGNSIGKEYMMAPYKLSEVKSLIKEDKIKDYKINEKGNIEGINKKLSDLPMYDNKGNFLDKRMEIRSAIEDSGNLVGAVVYFPLMGKKKKLKVDDLSLLYEYFEPINFGLRERDNKYYITGKGETKKEDIPVIKNDTTNKTKCSSGYIPFIITKETRHLVGLKGIENEKLVIPQKFEYNGQMYKVVSIGEFAFADCVNLVDIVIPNSVISIEDCAFADCINLISIEIPNSITDIPDELFGGCSNLNSIVLPDSIFFIGRYIFDDCGNLETIYYRGSESDWKAIKKKKGWADGIPKNCKIIYNYK